MDRLGHSDLRAVARFLGQAGSASLATPEDVTALVLEEVPALVPCDSVIHAHFDTVACRTATAATDARIVDLRERDGRAVRFSDFVTRRELRRREICHSFFAPCEGST